MYTCKCTKCVSDSGLKKYQTSPSIKMGLHEIFSSIIKLNVWTHNLMALHAKWHFMQNYFSRDHARNQDSISKLIYFTTGSHFVKDLSV